MVISVLILVLLVSSAQAVRKASISLTEDTSVLVSMPRQDLVRWEVITTKDTPIFIGFQNSGKIGDGFLIEPQEGNATITDLHFDPDGAPLADIVNDYTMIKKEAEGLVMYTVTRMIDTNDSQDSIFMDGENIMAFTSILENPEYEVFPVNFIMTNRRLDSGGNSSKASENALLHGLFTYIAWDWFSILLIISGRYSKYFYTFRVWLHGALGVLAAIFNIIGVAYSDIETDRKPTNSFGDVHTGIAGIITAWAIVVSVIGIICKVAGRFLKHKSYIAVWSRFIHLWLSYILIIYSNFVMLSGLYLYDSPVTYLFYIHVACSVVMLAALEICF